MVDRSHLSIGEVLSLLREEFPDVTISKIRFLESQGLVDPERTPSGYRKFYDHDVDRLRWILRQQRENFLPLKVIKGRLSDEDSGALDTTVHLGDGDGPPTPTPPVLAAVPQPVEAVRTAEAPATAAPAPTDPRPTPQPQPAPAPAANGPVPSAAVPSANGPAPFPAPVAVPAPAPDPPAPAPAPPAPQVAAAAAPAPVAEAAPADDSDDESFTLEELGSRTGLDVDQVEELAKFGLISVQSRAGGLDYYDREALAVARVAAGFAQHGIEARHLRAWRNAAEREVSLFEQIVIPQLRQRNPQARAQAAATLQELSDLGSELRQVLVRRGLRDVR